MTGVKVLAEYLSVRINTGGGTLDGAPNATVVDFSHDPWEINVGGGNVVTLDDEGAVFGAEGRLTIGLYDFLHVHGDFAIETGSSDLALWDDYSSAFYHETSSLSR